MQLAALNFKGGKLFTIWQLKTQPIKKKKQAGISYLCLAQWGMDLSRHIMINSSKVEHHNPQRTFTLYKYSPQCFTVLISVLCTTSAGMTACFPDLNFSTEKHMIRIRSKLLH